MIPIGIYFYYREKYKKAMEEKNIEIYKANTLVQNTINNLTRQQNRILCILMGKYIIGAVQSFDENALESKMIDSEMTLKEFLDLLELSDGAKIIKCYVNKPKISLLTV